MANIRALRIFSHSETYHLPFSPQHLSLPDIIYIILLILLKHLASLLRLHSPPEASPSNDGTFELPPLTLSAPLSIHSKDMELWRLAVADHSIHDSHASLFLPVAVTTPLMLLLLASPSSPILPFGAVNTKNRFEFLDPHACRQLSASSTSAQTRYIATARFGGKDLKGVRVKRGMEFNVVIEVIDIERDGPDRVIFRQTISTLQFMSSKARPVPPEDSDRSAVQEDFSPGGNVKELGLDINTPKRWAVVCKDYNPIHMSTLAAKAFGFSSKIAHGNHIVALIVQLMKSSDIQVGHEVLNEMWWTGDEPSYLEVAFKRPMLLPTVVQVETERSGGNNTTSVKIHVTRKDKVHVVIEAGWL